MPQTAGAKISLKYPAEVLRFEKRLPKDLFFFYVLYAARRKGFLIS